MSINTDGGLLEGIRISEGNNSFTFPPRTIINDQLLLNGITKRAEYVLIVKSIDTLKQSLEIADPDLRFSWTKNEGNVVRFGYDGFAKRWLPFHGGKPDELGKLQNSSRLVAPIPDTSIIDSPYSIYVGNTLRKINFKILLVGTVSDFTSPALLSSGVVELSIYDGKLNFSQNDILSYGGQTVLSQRQGFFSKISSTGLIGRLPTSSIIEYFIFLNPLPSTGQFPRLRIGYQSFLNPIEVQDESSLGSPMHGSFTWSSDTGRVRISPSDLDINAESNLYYDGITQGDIKINRFSLGLPTSSFPNFSFIITSAININDEKRFILFAELSGKQRHYINISIKNKVDISGVRPGIGTAYLDPSDGKVYLNPSDVNSLSKYTFYYIDSIIQIESGVSVQFYRSGVNSSGPSKVNDFTVQYLVKDQIIVNTINASPFIMLPTTPVVNSTLEFKVSQAPASNGTFTGILSDGTSPTSIGLSYLLDLDSNKLHFSNRKNVVKTLLKNTPSIKLDDGAISKSGFEITRNGIHITQDSDYYFDSDTGLIEFLKPVGENEIGNVSGISGSISIPDTFTSDSYSFALSDVGHFITILDGDNVGIYEIINYLNIRKIQIKPEFISTGSAVINLKMNSEIIADRFWTELRPEYKKFSISSSDSMVGISSILNIDEYTISINVGQVNLAEPTRPGQVFKISYVALETNDGGGTYSQSNKIEYASFKIRNEIALTSVGSKTITFNNSGKTVDLNKPIKAYLNGIQLKETSFQFVAPGTLILHSTIQNDQSVILSYWVNEASGGETTFDLSSAPISLDTPQIIEGENTTLNGDQTNLISALSAVFVGKTEIVIINSVSYDPITDTTHVIFKRPPTFSSNDEKLLVSGPIDGSEYKLNESSTVDVFTQGTNFILINGDVTSSYRQGTIITVDSDPFNVLASSYEEKFLRTRVTLSTKAKRNYIIPKVTKTIRPVLFKTSNFKTSLSANIDLPFTLISMGSTRRVFSRNIDYSISEGGEILLNSSIGFPDSLHALYVSRVFQPIGTHLTINYAYAISPGSSNGLQGQRLLTTYDLYAPDTFFYRVETIGTFIPEVMDLLRSSSSFSSGPSTQNISGLSNKDFGRISPYFDEQHIFNVDTVIRSLLVFYNDFINGYEDILSNIDGRIVGGNNGRFKFDGLINNPPRLNQSSVTNDIDDNIKLYDSFNFTGFFSFKLIPVYGNLANPNRLSRLFPTYAVQSAAINSNVGSDNRGNPIGSLSRKDINSVQSINTSRSRSFFTTKYGSKSFTIKNNGDPLNVVPRFETGQDVSIHTLDGVKQYTDKIISVSSSTPVVITLGISSNLIEGSILQDISDTSNTINHFYIQGRDLVVDIDNGQIINNTYSFPLNKLQNKVYGNEILDFIITLNNNNIKPNRIPVLDGVEKNDDGNIPEPLLRRNNELDSLSKELIAFSSFGLAKISSDLLTATDVTIPVSVGNEITFLDGPNSGYSRIVKSVGSQSFLLSTKLPHIDPIGSNFKLKLLYGYKDALLNEIKVTSTNIVNGPVSTGSKITTIDSNKIAVNNITKLSSNNILSGTGIVNTNTLTNTTSDFSLIGLIPDDLIYISSSLNQGLYKIISVTPTILTIDTSLPFQQFPVSSSVSYSILRLLPFIGKAHSEFYAAFIRETYEFIKSTQSFLDTPTDSGKISRSKTISKRVNSLKSFTSQIEGILIDDNLYEVRYLWIDQRTNRKDGTLVMQNHAISRRKESLQKIVENQHKLLVASSI